MIHLYANVYLRPYEMGIIDKEHLYTFKTNSFGFGTGTPDTALVKSIHLEEPSVKQCVEYSLDNDDVRIVVYVAPMEFQQILAGFIKDLSLGDYDTIVNLYKNWYKTNWELFHAVDVNVRDRVLPYSDFESKYFSDFPTLEEAVSLDCNNDHLGIEWKLYRYISGDRDVHGLKEQIMYIFKGSLASEIGGLKLGLEKIPYLVEQEWLELSDEGFYESLNPLVSDEMIIKSACATDYYIKKYGLEALPQVRGLAKRNICDKIAKTGKLPTYTEVIKDAIGPNNLDIFNHLVDREYVNLDIIALAKSLK
jgi:hypothetical protein